MGFEIIIFLVSFGMIFSKQSENYKFLGNVKL